MAQPEPVAIPAAPAPAPEASPAASPRPAAQKEKKTADPTQSTQSTLNGECPASSSSSESTLWLDIPIEGGV
ncbi:hypothetical protein M9H77_24865 [Catharanthus roseus]|uniref:Uncharacterized protein n=1 Tax=Catharanthus roseus TaxID=4058 RepID=A0ACC0A7Z1_CATRO|nr:hypothetical protein M9H77_24865 [Catharanthus roseus]